MNIFKCVYAAGVDTATAVGMITDGAIIMEVKTANGDKAKQLSIR